ncbi:hypothetical protein HYALB_00010566 [Hymenoscyphus albidus]|uniref:Uncharacterized protein n=1 Tax=Hymenoscyphus albidus TaxID=595503 RepID=A0A9N9LCD3_9HELO|nr:hypothetical protein HYALB_00010566 [Hymenoscyphus albidus]
MAHGPSVPQRIKKRGGIINMCRNGRIREGALKSKRITEDGLDEIIKDYEEWSRREDASIAMMQGEIIIHKYARVPCGAAGNFRYGL